MNRQLRADGGIMQVAPREKFGLGSSIKKFVRKIIPNEVADIAVKAAPFVAPFNPAVAAAMSGLGTFDQTGSIGDSLKGGALTYGLGQGARYLGGAGFQGNPFAADGGAFRGGLEGFKSGFTSPLGNQTGFKLGKPVEAVEGVGIDTSKPLKKPDILSEQMSELSLSPSGAVTDVVVDKSIVTQNDPGFLKNLFDGISNQDYGKVAQTIGDGAKKFGKAMFTNKDGSIDKAAVMGAVTFAASYAEAKALAADAGIDLTEEEYDETQKADKKEEYAGYLTNFFGGRKDGGRIGYKDGTNNPFLQIIDKIAPEEDPFQKLITKISPVFIDEDGDYRKGLQKAKFALSKFLTGKGTDLDTGSEWYNKLDDDTQKEIIKEKIKYRDRGYIGGTPMYDEEFAGRYGIGGNYESGGRVGYKDAGFTTVKDLGIEKEEIEPKFQYDLKDLDIERDKSKVLVMDEDGSTKIMDKEIAETLGLKIIADSFDTEKISKVEKKANGGRIGFKDGSSTGSFGTDRYVSEMLESGSGLFNRGEDFMNKYDDMVKEGKLDSRMFDMLKEYKNLEKEAETTEDKFQNIDLIDKAEETLDKDALKYYTKKEKELEKQEDDLTKKEEGIIALEQKTNFDASEITKTPDFQNWLRLYETDKMKAFDHPYADIYLGVLGVKLKGRDKSYDETVGFANGGLMGLKMGGMPMEMDYRQGGFIPVGSKERADDVPARLSKNEFVMTADAVRAAGGGSVNKGAQRMYELMNNLEARV